MENYVDHIQIALILFALFIAFSTLKSENKQLVIASIFAGVTMLLHVIVELLELSELLYSITGLLYIVTLIMVVLALSKKELGSR